MAECPWSVSAALIALSAAMSIAVLAMSAAVVLLAMLLGRQAVRLPFTVLTRTPKGPVEHIIPLSGEEPVKPYPAQREEQPEPPVPGLAEAEDFIVRG